MGRLESYSGSAVHRSAAFRTLSSDTCTDLRRRCLGAKGVHRPREMGSDMSTNSIRRDAHEIEQPCMTVGLEEASQDALLRPARICPYRDHRAA